MARYLPGDRRDKLNEMIRVNHSGELGAINIYKGQIAATKHIMGKSTVIKTLEEMYQGEIPHFQYFKSLMEKNKVRPSIFTPIWSNLGFFVGYITALFGKETAMTLTVGVETIIGNHYKEQLNILKEIQPKSDLSLDLAEKIAQFLQDELEHLETGVENNAEDMCCHFYFRKIIELGTKVAISIAKNF